MFEGIRDKVEGLADTFNKKSFRRVVLGVALLGAAGFGANLYVDHQNAPHSADYGPRADLRPVLVEAARQQAALQEWKENWQTVCYVAGQPVETASARGANQAREFLQKMAQEELVGGQAVKALEQLGTAICINDSRNAWDAVFIDATNSLTVRSDLAAPRQMLHVLEESRHAVQKTQGMVGTINTTFQETLRAAFALEADATATAMLAAYRLQAKGETSVWQTIAYDLSYIDMKAAFLGEMLKSGDEMKATRAVFDAWYDSPMRLQQTYSQTRARFENEKRWPVERPYLEKLPSNFFDRLGEMGDGSNYGANQSKNISKHHHKF
ncbi:MAG: hypothetical protein Q8K65_08045 [Alphaproteobacteria bacterium]|nr:hypothetical protein [Alphaproteobacteria bacterium]